MTENEIEMAMDGLLIGAGRVRAYKYPTKTSKNVHKQFNSRLAVQIWNKEKQNFKAA